MTTEEMTEIVKKMFLKEKRLSEYFRDRDALERVILAETKFLEMVGAEAKNESACSL